MVESKSYVDRWISVLGSKEIVRFTTYLQVGTMSILSVIRRAYLERDRAESNSENYLKLAKDFGIQTYKWYQAVRNFCIQIYSLQNLWASIRQEPKCWVRFVCDSDDDFNCESSTSLDYRSTELSFSWVDLSRVEFRWIVGWYIL